MRMYMYIHAYACYMYSSTYIYATTQAFSKSSNI